MAIPKGATIRRAKHDSKYFVMSRSTAQDENLSFEALGMMTYLLSKPDDWEIRVDDLARQDGCKEGRIYRIINDLVDAGYMIPRKRIRNDDGTFGWTPYTLYERPKVQHIEPYPQNPQVDEPDMDEPQVENHRSNSSTDKHSTEEQNTENKKTNTPLPPKVSDSQEAAQGGELSDLLQKVMDALKALGVSSHKREKLAQGLLGKRTGNSKKYNIEGAPVTPDEIHAFKRWWDMTKSNLDYPTNFGSVKEWIEKYRKTTDYKQWQDSKTRTHPVYELPLITGEDVPEGITLEDVEKAWKDLIAS